MIAITFEISAPMLPFTIIGSKTKSYKQLMNLWILPSTKKFTLESNVLQWGKFNKSVWGYLITIDILVWGKNHDEQIMYSYIVQL